MISVVIPSLGGDLSETLNSLNSGTVKPDEIIVCLPNKDHSVKFGNREIITGKTAELVKDAKLILNHDSTSFNFVALWKVPMIFITTDQIERALYP